MAQDREDQDATRHLGAGQLRQGHRRLRVHGWSAGLGVRSATSTACATACPATTGPSPRRPSAAPACSSARRACNECHSTPLLSDSKFHNVGVPQVGPGVPTEADCPAGGRLRLRDRVRRPRGQQLFALGRRRRPVQAARATAGAATSKWSDDPTDTTREALARRWTMERIPRGAWRTPSPARRGPDRALHAQRVAADPGRGDRALQPGRLAQRPGTRSAQIKPLFLTVGREGRPGRVPEDAHRRAAARRAGQRRPELPNGRKYPSDLLSARALLARWLVAAPLAASLAGTGAGAAVPTPAGQTRPPVAQRPRALPPTPRCRPVSGLSRGAAAAAADRRARADRRDRAGSRGRADGGSADSHRASWSCAWSRPGADRPSAAPAVSLGGYVDFGFFVPQGDGSGIVRDNGNALFPQYAGQYGWVFLGDLLATGGEHAAGEVADLGDAAGAARFDSIHSRGAPGFIANEINLTLSSGAERQRAGHGQRQLRAPHRRRLHPGRLHRRRPGPARMDADRLGQAPRCSSARSNRCWGSSTGTARPPAASASPPRCWPATPPAPPWASSCAPSWAPTTCWCWPAR